MGKWKRYFIKKFIKIISQRLFAILNYFKGAHEINVHREYNKLSKEGLKDMPYRKDMACQKFLYPNHK
jgi:hypothetical protein